VVALLSISLIAGLSPDTPSDSQQDDRPEAQASIVQTNPIPDVIRNAPDNRSPVLTGGAPRSTVPKLGEPLPGNLGRTMLPAADPYGPATAGSVRNQMRIEELYKARAAGLFFSTDDATASNSPTNALGDSPPPMASVSAIAANRSATQGGAAAGSQAPEQNLQEHKNDFLARAGAKTSDYLEQPVVRPRSPYEVKAGTIIPTVLITGINSDLPGQIVGQVRENVYDTVSGNYLLIPQGSRLLAAYDSMVAFGQERVLVCWNRIIRPDGTSINLECMPGVDLSGYAGFADQVDHHWWRVLSGVVLGSFLAAGAATSQGNVTNFQPTFPQLWAQGFAGAINQAGQQITQKNINIQPTITVRPGFSVNVLVSKDIVIPPSP
jgi:type IV secretion system protein VirB10